MARWIITDYGFGGQSYRCSDCGESWCDLFSDVSTAKKCPNCGAPINGDETEYVEEKINPSSKSRRKKIMQYEETGRIVTRVRILSSGNLGVLEDYINKFIEDKTGVEVRLMPDSVTPYYTALITYREYVEN